jgi:ligand-binding sensor domain-containing protein/signal transduction histidine kinase/ActR/RegA family two-component response regulator
MIQNNIKLLCFTTIFYFASLAISLSYSFDEVKIQRLPPTGRSNHCITQDKDGLFWLSTWGKGLCFYDGFTLKRAKIIGSKHPFAIVWSLFVDREGLVWFFTEGHGLYSYNKNTGICDEYRPEPGDPNSLTSSSACCLSNNITQDKEGLIWVGTDKGLNSFNKETGKFTQYKHNPNDSNSLSNNNIWTVFVSKNGLIWIGTDDGLNCYDKKTNKFTCYKNQPGNLDSLSNNQVYAIVEDREGKLWLGTKNTGIDKFDPKTNRFTNYRHNHSNLSSISCNEIHHMMLDQFNNLWVCYEGSVGIDRYNIKTNSFTHYKHNPKNPNSISSNNILCSFEDKTGIVWLINDSGGIDKCTWKKDIFRKNLHNPKDSSSISSDNIIKLYEDKRGNIWIGTFRGGLCRYYRGGRFERFDIGSESSSLSGASVLSILDATDNKLWLGIYGTGSVNLFDTINRKVIKSYKNPYSDTTPCFLTKDNKYSDIIWFASFSTGGLFKFNTTTGKFIQYKHVCGDSKSVSNRVTLKIFQDDDSLWLATGGDGLTKFSKATEQCIHYRHDPNDNNSISGNIVFAIHVDTKGEFWVTTEDGGLNKFDKSTEKFTSYGINCGFPSNTTIHILEDDEGFLWISTDSGIVKFDTEKKKVVRLFTKADGLPDIPLYRVTSVLKDTKGDFWFSWMGICKFNPKEASKIQRNSHIPSIMLKTFRSKGETYNEEGVKRLTDLTLPWTDNSFTFTFTALDYTDPPKNQLAFKLEGFDQDWYYIGTNNFGEYANLPPGKYILRLKGANSDGLWNEKGISVKITIRSPYWAAWWFRGIIAIIFIGIVILMIQYIRKIQKRRAIAMKDRAIVETSSYVAHDIRKPFVGLKMMLQVLPKLTPEQTKSYSEDLDVSIRKIDAMLTDIMEASRDMKYVLTPSNILIVLDLAIKDISLYHPNKHVDFYYALDTVALIKLDEQRMARAFENIIENAFDCLPDEKGFMWFSVKKNKNNAIITIGNSHSHISKDQIKKIFQNKFTSGKKEGTGLGLSIVTKVINGHDGSIAVRNVGIAPIFVPEGIRNIQGVEFEMILPLTNKPGYSVKGPLLKNTEGAKAKLGIIQKKSQLAGSSEIDILIKKLESVKQKPNLLILDDESIYRMRIRDVLENIDDINKLIHVYDASSYKEALDIFNHTKIDYLICDIDLSDKKNDGFSVLSEALKKYPRSMVLIHTNHKESKEINKAKTMGACGFCPKPISEAILVDFLMDKKLWPDNLEGNH